MSTRKRGRITVQHQPTGAEQGMRRMMGVVHAVFGIVFVVAALSVIIPNAGFFGLPFLAAGLFFAVNGIRMAVSKNEIPHRVAYDVEQDMAQSIVGIMEDAPEEAETAAPGSTERRLQELKDLYEKDLINREEYEAKRRDILEDL